MATLTHAENLIALQKTGNAIGMYNYAKINQLSANTVDGYLVNVIPGWYIGKSTKWMRQKGFAPLPERSLAVEPVAFPAPLVSPVAEPLSPYIAAPVADPLSPYIAAPVAEPLSPYIAAPATTMPVKKDNMLLYIGLGVAGLAAFFMMRKR